MKNNPALVKTVTAILVLSLVFVGMPAGTVAASNGGTITVDVWTNKGGKGANVPGGTFKVGEETIIYLRANTNCLTRWTLSGPSMTDSGEQAAQAGRVYELSLGQAEQGDIGQWEVVVEARLGTQYASDTTTFTVVGAEPEPSPAPEPEPAPPPPPPEPEEEPTIKIDATSAIELAALMALKMAEGSLAADLNMDIDGDGQVTIEDARLILDWAVESQGGLPSPSQQEIVEAFGPPSQFILTYLVDDEIDCDLLVRTEIWLYPEHQQKITFIAGDAYSVDDLPPAGEEISYSDLKPEDFDCFMNYEQVVARIGDSVEPIDLLPEGFEDCSIECYLGDKVFFIMENGQLAYLQTFGTEEELGLGERSDGGKQLGIAEQLTTFAAGLTLNSLIHPPPVSARLSFKKFARWLGKTLKKGARALHRIPRKVARLFPKEVRPVVIAIIEHKLSRMAIWHKAAKVNNIAALEGELKKLKGVYQQQAKKIDEKVKKLKAEKKKLDETPPSALGMTYRQWKDQWDSLGGRISRLEEKSQKLKDKADKAKLGNISRMALGGLTKKMLKNLEKAIIQETSDEFEKKLGGNGIRTFVETGAGGLSVADVIDLFIDGSIARALKEMSLDPASKDRLEKILREELKKGGRDLRNMDELLAEAIKKFREGEEALTKGDEEEEEEEEQVVTIDQNTGSYSCGVGWDLFGLIGPKEGDWMYYDATSKILKAHVEFDPAADEGKQISGSFSGTLVTQYNKFHHQAYIKPFVCDGRFNGKITNGVITEYLNEKGERHFRFTGKASINLTLHGQRTIFDQETKSTYLAANTNRLTLQATLKGSTEADSFQIGWTDVHAAIARSIGRTFILKWSGCQFPW